MTTITSVTSLKAPFEVLDIVTLTTRPGTSDTATRTGLWWAETIRVGLIRQVEAGLRDARDLPSRPSYDDFVTRLAHAVGRHLDTDGSATLTWNATPCLELESACFASRILGTPPRPLPLIWRLTETTPDQLRALVPTASPGEFWMRDGIDRRSELRGPVENWRATLWPTGTHVAAGHQYLDPAEVAVIERIRRLANRELARLAGIVDVQSSMFISQKGVVTFQLDSTDRELVEHVATLVSGCHPTAHQGQNSEDSPHWKFLLEGRAAVVLYTSLVPFMIVRPNQARYLATLPGYVWPRNAERVATMKGGLKAIVEPSGSVGKWPSDGIGAEDLHRRYIAGYLSARAGFSIGARDTEDGMYYDLTLKLSTGGDRLLEWIRTRTGVVSRLWSSRAGRTALTLRSDDVHRLLGPHLHLLVANRSRANIAWRWVTTTEPRAALKAEMDHENAAYQAHRVPHREREEKTLSETGVE